MRVATSPYGGRLRRRRRLRGGRLLLQTSLHHRPCRPGETLVVFHELANVGLGNSLSQLVVALHFAALHGRMLVAVRGRTHDKEPMPMSSWVWSNGTGFLPSDVYWPSACELLLQENPSVRSSLPGIRMHEGTACPAWGCAWANALPPEVGSVPGARCVVTAWYRQLTRFLLRPSERLTAAVAHAGRSSCDARLCGDGGSDGGGGWLDERARRLQRAGEGERRSMAEAAREHWRPPWALSLASRLRLLPGAESGAPTVGLHIRVGDACTGLRPYEQRLACAYARGGFQGSVDWPSRLRGFWRERLRERGALPSDAPPGSAAAARVGTLLLSTDDEAAFDDRHRLAETIGAERALGFGFARRKYAHDEAHNPQRGAAGGRPSGPSGFVETRLLRGRLDARQLLVEALLDLGLLAQADAWVGSMYSNFARLALQLSDAGSDRGVGRGARFDYLTFDALWCPYVLCNVAKGAARADEVQRMCHRPRVLALTELAVGTRGDFQANGTHPGRVPPHPLDDTRLVPTTHAARAPWVALMRAVLRLPFSDADAVRRNATAMRISQAACRALFEQAAPSLSTMPNVY